MLTAPHLEIFSRYAGDNDGFARSGTAEEKKIMGDSSWALICDLLQDLQLVLKNQASAEFKISLEQRLRESADNEATSSRLLQMAKEENDRF